MTEVLRFNYREKGEPSRARDFLPPDKQYLVTRNGESFAAKLYQALTMNRQSPVFDEQRLSITQMPMKMPKNCLASLTTSVSVLDEIVKTDIWYRQRKLQTLMTTG